MALGTTPAAAHATPAGQTGIGTASATRPTVKPKPKPQPTTVQITGQNVAAEGITVLQSEDPKLFRMLMDEVGWLASATPQTTTPKAAKLGPKYTVKLLVKETVNQTYELYPLAVGGPRAHRPGSKKVDGWFYGRLSMSESLRLSGVPLKAKPDVVNGGIGGGVGENLSADQLDPATGVPELFGQMRRLILLNGAVLLVILTGLAGMAFLIRRRV
ncbi:hypothetical protein [Actinoplanes palleronii]|uniref:Uncharacterized protein n=1 Tax=Actinoplanes palleronii TaxID=113570 RepID=A0ABQ4B2F4_9ACTN|nr:hypothetical protein [Actinoplanes palleronii]GIE64756.1 hypothetical protein Apa02nite_008640 [Actinoplanes palleronii]